MMSHSRDMLSKLRSQREAGLFCDITLRTDGCSYSAHKAVLAAVSEYFQELFTEMDSHFLPHYLFPFFTSSCLVSPPTVSLLWSSQHM
uniref:BTB domain-containing protein n=1 Tax=Oncorhynchus kisutch TaxID=8019 RepID=A0A8C7FR35_ONCKI